MAWLSLLLILFVVAPGLGGFGRLLLRKWTADLDPALGTGVSFLAGLGFAGTLAYFLGMISTSLSLGIGVVLLIAGWYSLLSNRPIFAVRRGAVGLLAAASLIPIVGVVVPSTMMDWDSIAYHLALPKIWLADGRVSSVSFVHHSNFPFGVDGLNLLALPIGGQAAGKAFQLAYLWFGLMALFGLVREKFGEKAAWWSCAAFACIPLVQWESGSAYIDVAHGLYAGLGTVLAIQGMRDRPRLMLGAVMLGLALGSKYTGLQSLFALGVVLVGMLALKKSTVGFKPVLGALGLALLVGGPWYLKNAAVVGNPVYPFFYEQLGGKNWDQRQADVYRNEQKTFGVPPALPLSVPHSILGVAYQPGRYVNPVQKLEMIDGKPFGAGGYPIGAAGFVIFLAGLLAAFRRSAADEAEGPILAWLLVSLLMWSVLSQQSRYALSFAPPLCYLLGSLVSRPHWFGRVLMGAVVVQGLVTLYACKELLLTPVRMKAAFGSIPAPEYLMSQLPFYDAAEQMNKDASVKKVALFDEVFGFYLDKPYFWASYGHTTEMGYEHMQSADEFLASLRKLEISHVYINLRFADEEFKNAVIAASNGQPLAVDPVKYIPDAQLRWKGFLLQAIQKGQLRPVTGTRSGLILQIP